MIRRRVRHAVVLLCLAVVAPLVVSSPAAAADRHLTGVTRNGAWVLDIPSSFNGTLLLWSHGYTFTPVEASNAPSVATRDALLAEGFALAGSSYKGGGAGWAVNQGVAAGRELIGIAKRNIGTAQVARVYAWGNSLGGLITQTLAERNPALVSGVAPLCGVLGGTNLNLDLALDVAVAVKLFFYPALRLQRYASAADAQANVDAAMAAILAGLANPSTQPTTAGRLLGITALLGASAKTKDFSGAGLTSAVSAAVETIQTGLTYGTVGRYDIEARVGGNASTNIGVDYTKRIDDAALARFQAFGFAPGLLKAYAKTLQAFGQRVRANKAARARANGLGNPTGRLLDKTVTMHTQYDPLVLLQNEKVFADRVQASGRASRLHQLWVVPPATYVDGSPAVSTDGAPYGAGHCNFATSDYLAAVHALDGWVRTGSYTAPAEVGGLRNSLAVPSWPAR
jgi:pimeloyl-ACP methyl ester carboxylesterase